MITTEKKYLDSTSLEPKMVCKDHLVTGEKFDIVQHENGILKTHPFPEHLSRYYESNEYISHTDSAGNLQDKIYQLVKSYMLSKKAKWIRKNIKHGSILDFGAGTGEFLNKMKSYFWNVEGVEPNKLARDLGILKGLNLKSDLSQLPKKKFDVISLWHVLEHLPDLEDKIREFENLLDENGILIVAVPNHNSYDANFYGEYWAAWDVPRHLWHFSREGIESKFQESGFELFQEKALKFDSFYVSLLSEKNKNGSTNPFKAFYRGYISNLKAQSTGEYSSIAYFFRKSG
ncbi:class I SAM-dependent methyltransferase [Pontixanthobacter gangjinensis]|uniref:Class I SAM-dependent methyltransferase n=1 Tax=Christiangramia aestuarii TaxID=1028746 RepID=A0A7K1LRH4_9FLAO|nr:class I SAM-dependent methyltransferase [Christiangramia aestuarii]MUP43358.1 class I SAM-dependent methyltransferase [Christiangramia aestuarii]